MKKNSESEFSSFLLGIGLDGKDGHFRLTRGESFRLVGGSEKTHEKMQDKVLELTDDLAKKGRTISDLGPDDFERVSDILKD